MHTLDDMFRYCVENIAGVQLIYLASKDIKDEELKLVNIYLFCYNSTRYQRASLFYSNCYK
jgi:hypothetical protein